MKDTDGEPTAGMESSKSESEIGQKRGSIPENDGQLSQIIEEEKEHEG